MERTIENAGLRLSEEKGRRQTDGNSEQANGPFLRLSIAEIVSGERDVRSLTYGIGAGLSFFGLGVLCLSLSRFDATLASVWAPNASAIALLMLARLRNELPALIGIAIASLCANMWAGTSAQIAAVFTIGNLVNIVLVTSLTRRACGECPDLTDLSHLGRFLQYGGLLGPLAGVLIVAPVLGSDVASIWAGSSGWFLADSMGIMLIVPACLLIAQGIDQQGVASPLQILECAILITGGVTAVYLVFIQPAYPLLFLVPPITLLMALRLGGIGTALFLPCIAFVTCAMTLSGLGPIFQATASEATRMNLIQAFIAANFLTGLPVAAILARRERMTEEIEQARRELALLTEGITDAVLLINLEGICTYASPSVSTVLGRPAEQFVGHSIAELAHKDARARIEDVLEKLITGSSEQERFTYRRLGDDADGNPVFIEADCAIVDDTVTGERGGIVVSARDVTERVELELLLTRARRSAEKAASAKSDFLANMSHEIRTPMNGVLGFAELMREGDLDEENRRYADMIVQSGRSMMMLLNDILDLSKIEAGHIGITTEAVDLFAVARDCASLHRPRAEEKGLTLSLSFAETVGEDSRKRSEAGGLWIKTDGLRLRQILLNLVGNAVKFTENGRIDVVVEADDQDVSIKVEDTGIGISPNRLKSIFAPFTQGENETSRRYGGTGLGLSISRQLAELLGGTISVRSEAGVGSTFRLTLPAIYTEPAPAEPPTDTEIDPSQFTGSASILLVEDHDVNRMLVTEMLERCGQSVAIAQDGNEAIAMVIDSMMRGSPFDLVLMDIQMPGCDGYTATRAIRAEGICADTMPIIALTANAFPEDIVAAREAGMQAHLSKPLVFAELARALQRWLPTRIVEHQRNADTQDDLGTDEAAPINEHGGGDTRSPHIPAEVVDISRDRLARSPMIGEALKASPSSEIVSAISVDPAKVSDAGPAHRHSPTLLKRWNERRSEAVEAVRAALEDGALGDNDDAQERRDSLARTVHKLAGTAALFGEPELGDHAAAFENALRLEVPASVREALAFELLSIADDPADTLAKAGG